MKRILLAMALLSAVPVFAQKKPKDNTPKSFDLLIGTYTTGESKGIYVYRFYTETGATAYLNEVDGIDNPSYLCVAANNHFVYSVNEVGTERKGSVSSFSFDPKEGRIALLNKQPSTGTGPCYISIDKAQKHVFVANYASGALSVLPIAKDGTLLPVVQTIQDAGTGPNKARQEGPHVHTAVLSPDEKYLLYTDLGTDKLNIYRYKPSQPQPLTPADPSVVKVLGGHGPRHIDFTPDRKFMYLITEMGGVIYVYDYNKGEPKQLEAISIVADGFKGAVGAADIHVSPDGKFLYATNRGDANEIVVFAINPDTGSLTFVERKPSMGKTPRNFVIDPTGNFLLVANQMSDDIYVYKRDKATGKLTLTRNKISVGNPSCLKFTPAE
ncbi:6-phosphogluconolactonase [Mucilaginibacter yixingensis]|uniref:6-phosphogluconolactonase n=1 Tax=Mucilaginibacter yixingensis TaxID=1295612 RepID=A0A2T5J5H9_9SPHI|nr:lactonase family protein [Mucilaginibacter yixingensis]PTQ93230.1 6-phosphogluconolactonase [Mucilaginibacter yixingensis]